MDAIQGAFSMPIPWMVQECALPVVYQGLYLTYPILISSLAIRLCVLWLPLRELIYDVISFSLGAWVLWWYYQSSVVYFVVLLIFIYSLLLIVPVGKRGVVVGGACMMFVIVCELFIASAAEWHKVRGTFMVVSMKLVSLAYDVDSLVSSCPLPSVIRYLTYSIFPATTIFGPYVTYNEHVKYTQRTSLSMNWFFHVIRSLTFSLICLSFSSCFFVFLFEDNSWNKWLTAYSSASSFRFSHFFVSLLSECSTIMSGLGYSVKSDGHVSWKGFRVVYPLDVEIPRSMGSLVTSWNIPMHHFLKNYVFKPTLVRLNYIGAFFFTFLTSALLHGLNFQLAAVLLSIALYAYIENRFRYRLSKRLDACLKDRPCSTGCSHKYKSSVFWVMAINSLLTLLSMFHLIYLGVMFGGDEQSEEGESVMAQEGYSMMHTLRHWSNLDFLSHYVSLATLVISFVI